MNRGASLIGVALVALHVAALPVMLERCRRDDLAVQVTGAPAVARFDLAGEVPASLRDQVVVEVDGTTGGPGVGPGLHHVRWRIAYRGGFTRGVGAAQLVGPFQDPARPPCGSRLVVGQAFLDDGRAGPGTVAALVQHGLQTELAGFDQFPAGRFVRVAAIAVRWARFDDTPEDRGLFSKLTADGGALLGRTWRTDGYARVHVVVELSRVTATITVALVPHVVEGRLAFEIYAGAELSYGNRAVDWAIRTFRIDQYATRVLRDQIDGAIIQAFDPPPPLPLPGGRALRVEYCPGAQVSMASRGWAALPLALRFEGPAGAAAILPSRLGAVAPPPPPPDTRLAFDLDLDAVNALLYELWRTGLLDEQLDAAGIDRRFNDDPTVQALLSLRISPLRLALPPVVSAGPRGLRLAADLRVNLADRGVVTPARAWAALDVDLGEASTDVDVTVAELELACEPAAGLLRPCYADLVAALRDRAGDLRAELSALLVGILDDLFAGQRVTAPDTPAELVLGAPRTTAHLAAPSATVRLEVPATLRSIP